MNFNYINILEKKAGTIISKYGMQNQLKKLNEESYELCDAILTGDEYTPMVHITEELADVCVLLLQIKNYYNIQFNDILKIMEYKINRQLDRIENETDNKADNEKEKYKVLEKLISKNANADCEKGVNMSIKRICKNCAKYGTYDCDSTWCYPSNDYEWFLPREEIVRQDERNKIIALLKSDIETLFTYKQDNYVQLKDVREYIESTVNMIDFKSLPKNYEEEKND